MHFNTMFPADVLAAFTHPFNIGHHHVGLIVVEAHVVLGFARVLARSVSIHMLNLSLFKAHTGYLYLSSVVLR